MQVYIREAGNIVITGTVSRGKKWQKLYQNALPKVKCIFLHLKAKDNLISTSS